MTQPFDETAWRAKIRELLGPWLASPAGQRSIDNAVNSGLEAMAREERRRIIHGDDVGPSEGRSFARMLGAYARCERGCLDRAEGNPECWDHCRRAKTAARRNR